MKRMIYGVDLGWATQLESMGYRWLDESGNETDVLTASQELGANAVRLRVFVNPPKDAFWMKRENEKVMLGFCDAQSVLEMSKRVKEHGMKLMIDFHYSDHFADPLFQDIPEEWKNDTDDQLEKRVYEHTREVLQLLTDHDIYPEWVQVGNEINNGMMWPKAHLKAAPKQLVRFLNAGYDAVKEVCPDCQVVTHLAAVCSEELCEPFWENFFGNHGKTDIMGFSYYPHWENYESDKDKLAGYLKRYAEEYHKPVLIAEIGGLDYDDEGSYKTMVDCIEAMKEMSDQEELTIFYWEPEATAEILPDKYPLSAAKLVSEKTLQYNKALKAYRDYQ